MTTEVESARRDWDEAYRRLQEATRDPERAEVLRLQLIAVIDELRKRVGGTFTLGELASEYHHADQWVREAVGADELATEWLPTLALVEGAAFRLYSRGAVDYEP